MLFTFKANKTTVSGHKTLAKTTEYRNKIVHWWVNPMDSGYLENRVQTINELLRKSTFRESSDASKPFSQRKGNLTVHGKHYSFVHRVHGESFDPLSRFPDLNHVHFLCWVDNIYWGRENLLALKSKSGLLIL